MPTEFAYDVSTSGNIRHLFGQRLDQFSAEVLRVSGDLAYWVSQPVDVYLVIRQTDETSGGQVIRWMNVTRYLNERENKGSRQIVFRGEKLDMEAVWKVRDGFFPVERRRAKG